MPVKIFPEDRNVVTAAQRILEEALQLPDADQLEIASLLLAKAAPDHCKVPDADWLGELRRRSDELDADPSSGLTWKQVKSERSR